MLLHINIPIIATTITTGSIDEIEILAFPEYIIADTKIEADIVAGTDFFFIPKYKGINATSDVNTAFTTTVGILLIIVFIVNVHVVLCQYLGHKKSNFLGCIFS